MRAHRGRVGVGVLLAVVALVAWAAFAPGALADTNTNSGPTPPQVSDPVGADVSPHGGYSATTGFCYQCHNVHNNPFGGLQAKASVTETCATCHGYLGAAPSGARPGYSGKTIGTTATRAVYETASGGSRHGIGATLVKGEYSGSTYTGPVITEGGWTYGATWVAATPGAVSGASSATEVSGPGTASAGSGGLYCGSCHTPHGEYGFAVNTQFVWSTDGAGTLPQTKRLWKEGSQTWWKNPNPNPTSTASPKPDIGWQYSQIHQDTADPGQPWELCPYSPVGVASPAVMPAPAPIASAPDTGCYYAQEKDQSGNIVSWYGYKLLAAFPNHSYTGTGFASLGVGASWGADKNDHDNPRWCGTCHQSRVDKAYGGINSTHPTGCTACHNNASTPTVNPTSGAITYPVAQGDWPHTSTNDSLLKAYPDALCKSCHLTGSKRLP